MADIFVSYTSSDREWAHWIALELEELGHVAHVHEWEIDGSESIYAWMEKRHDAADRVLCVVSDEYLKAPYSTLERHAALWQAATKRPSFVLLVAVRPCRFPTLSDHLRRCELFGVPEDVARLRFRQFIEAPVKPELIPFPGKVLAVSNIPIRVPEHFLGRHDALAEIDAALKRGEDRVAITTLHGLRGVGKTVLAAAYAERHRADYRATWWVRAQTPDTMRADLVSLGARLGWVADDEKEEPALEKVRERLRDEGEGLLLIYDNAIDADGVRTFLPTGGAARALITSNARVWRGLATPVEICVWPKEVGADFLIARVGRVGERSNAETLSNELGGLPLAHEQAAAYCERLEVSFAEYRMRFGAAPARILDADKDASADYHRGLTVAKTFALAIDEAAKVHPAAEPLITHAALLAPEPIPLFLFSEAREQFGEPLASQLAGDGLEEATAALRAFALVERGRIADERDPSISTETIRLHRLIRAVAAARWQGAAKEAGRRALVGAMAAIYPRDVFDSPTTWPLARRLDALACDLVLTAPFPTDARTSAAHLFDRLATYRQSALGALSEAQWLFEHALAIRETALGPDHPLTAQSLNNLALVLQSKGNHAGAWALFERALDITETRLGPETVELVFCLNNLASALADQGDVTGARSLFERALAIAEKLRGPEDPLTATTFNNLGNLHRIQGDLKDAQRLLDRALAIREKALGPDHPQTASTLGNIGLVAKQQGDLTGARSLMTQVLAINEKALGPEHLETNLARANLASVYLAEGTPAEALVLAEPALAFHEKAFGSLHSTTKLSASIVAAAFDALDRADDAAAVRARFGIKGARP